MTEPAAPVAPDKIKQDWTWVTHHILSLALAAALALGGIYLTESIVARHDAENSTKWNSILQTQAAQTAALQKQIASDEQAAAIRDAAYQKTITQLAQTISVRNAQATQQVKNDATLDAQQAAVRLATQTQAAPNEIVATNDSIVVDLPITRRIVGSLDLLPVAQQNLADTEKQLAAQQGLTADAVADDGKQKQIVSDLQQTVLDQDKTCLAQVKALKAASRKGKLKWFGIGYVAGFISGVTAHLW